MATRQLWGNESLIDVRGPRPPSRMENRPSATGLNSKPVSALHVQLADIIREKVYSKEWGTGSKIPSEHELMTQFGLARGTVRRAVGSLVDEGILVRHQGKGTFVAGPGLSHAAGTQLLSFAESLKSQGKSFETIVLEKSVAPAPLDVSTRLDIPDGSEALFLRRVRRIDGSPIMCQESWLSIQECPGIDHEDYTKDSLFDIVERCAKRKIKYSEMRYMARIVGKEHAELLQCDEGAAVLLLEQVISLFDHRPIEWSNTWFKPGQSITSSAEQAE